MPDQTGRSGVRLLKEMGPFGFTSDRRSFLKAVGPFVLSLRTITLGQIPIERGRFSKDDVPNARQRLLQMVNYERKRHGLSQLELDELACTVAEQHANDMLDGGFLSHWGRDGRKPYHRYSFAGGTDATQENASLAENIASASPLGVERNLMDMHQSMFDEVAPDDGHRKTILFPQHTHVGFGIAVKEYNVRLDELYICRYVEVDPVARTAKPASRINFSGRVLNPKHELVGIYVYHEPLPTPPAIEWLRIPRPYGLPNVYAEFLPRLPSNYSYSDGTKGSVEVASKGRFRVTLPVVNKPGINTIVVWIQRSEKEDPFPATQVCIRCD